MKSAIPTVLIIFIVVIFSCKKVNTLPPPNPGLIQHKWMLVSLNGEALRYVGTPDDYYNFSTDNFLYRHVANTYDTMAYVLLPGNKTLTLYPVINGVRTNVGTNYDIKVLDSNHFVLGIDYIAITNVLDSLKR